MGLAGTAAGSSGLVPKLYAALTFAFAGAGASYLFLANETLTVRRPCLLCSCKKTALCTSDLPHDRKLSVRRLCVRL